MLTFRIALPKRRPCNEQTVWRDILPVRDKVARHLRAMPAEQVFELSPLEPFLPSRCLKTPPMRCIFVNDDDAPAWPDNSAHLVDGFPDVHRMFKRFGGVGGVERSVCERQRRHRPATWRYRFGDETQHSFSQIETNKSGFRILIFQNSRESTLTAADIEYASIPKISKIAEDQLDMKDARVDCGRKMLLVGRSLIEAAPDFIQGDRGGRFAKPTQPARQISPLSGR